MNNSTSFSTSTCLNNTSTNNFNNNNNNSSNSTWIGDELPNNSKKRGIQKKAPRRQKTSKNIPLHSNHNIQSTSFKVLQSTENSMMGVFKKTRSMCSLASYESVWNMNNVMIQNSSPSIIITSSPHCPQQQQQQFSTSNSTTQTITNTSRKKRIMSCSSLSSMCDSSSSENTIIASASPLLNNITSSASQNQSLIIPHSQPSWNSCESQIVQLPPFSAIIMKESPESLSHISPEQQSKKGRSQMLSLSELLN